MKTKITQTINNCEVCQTLKYDRRPPKLKFEITEVPSKPLDIIHIDLYTINGKYVLTILDKFSKFAAAYSVPTRNSLCMTKSIRHFISIHGIPRKIVADQGTEFNSNVFKDFCKQYDIDFHITSFQQTTSNAPVERLHSTLTEIYRIIYEKGKDRDHDDILNETLITYNNAIHSVTKLTPYEVFYGKTNKFLESTNFKDEHEYLAKLNEFQSKFYPTIKNKIKEITAKTVDKLNKNREDPHELKENESIFRKECRRNKLTPRFSKQKVKQNTRLAIITTKNKKLHKARIKRKRKFQGSPNNDDTNANDNTNDIDNTSNFGSENGTTRLDQ